MNGSMPDECLKAFELSDIAKYLDENEGDYINVIQDYLNENIELAHEKEYFDYLDDCYISKSLLYKYDNDYENCLKESLIDFILKLNPVYSYEIYYAIYLIFNSYIVDCINESLGQLDNVDLKSLFDELWDLKDSEEDFCSKDEGFSYLKRALDGEDLDDLSNEYEEKYIGIIVQSND